ncbi:MAG: dephospho-CoA kinase [Betaproteobacteria bacterium]|jgi:dephospho-CoA kinase
MVYVVCLTGGIGSGKSAAATRFAALGAEVIDTDDISRELTGPGGGAMDAIVSRFGPAVVEPDGRLRRDQMRALVFEDATARQTLEEILHPMIRQIVGNRIAASKAAYVVLVVPLLVETGGYRSLARRVAVVDCSEQTQIERTMSRSGLSRAAVERILAAQATRAQRIAAADDVIGNEGSIADLDEQVRALHAAYMEAALAGC